MAKNYAQTLTPARVQELRALIRIGLRRRAEAFVPPDPPPRYDDVFARGQQWLDQGANDDEEPCPPIPEPG